MRLSEAIRLGSMLRPQGFEDYLSVFGSCAIGAACEAFGIDARDHPSVAEFEKQWRGTVFRQPCPVCSQSTENFTNTVTHLNDVHRWTRERIADWVATLEPADVAAPVPESVVNTEGLAPSGAAAVTGTKVHEQDEQVY